jgi:pimeloyl-ACP methyl ester carboxylesterase
VIEEDAPATGTDPEPTGAPGDVVGPGWQPPARCYRVDAWGVNLAVYEWGEPDAPPLVLTHGTADFARSFDGLAPLLAAGGWRVAAWDQRGHGDSDQPALYSWDADLRDLLAVMDRLAASPMPLVGHSKGGMLVTMLADALPHRVSHVVNLDGFATRLQWWAPTDEVSAEWRSSRVESWLDRRRRGVERRPGSHAELTERRLARNPRLSPEWAGHLVDVGARPDVDGWRWKLDPHLEPTVSQVMRQEWPLHGMPALGMPLLVLLGLLEEPAPMDQTVDDLRPFLPPDVTIVGFADAGHFLHAEHPARVAQLILDFLKQSSS